MNKEQLVEYIQKDLERIKAETLSMLPSFIDKVVKPNVINFTPTPDEEINILVKDESGVGTTTGGRFTKRGVGGAYTRKAINMERAITNKDEVVFANKSKLRELSKFGWRRHQYINGRWVATDLLETHPFDFNYIMALEVGGSWTVVPRQDRKNPTLYPENGIFKKSMIKRVKTPYRMFDKGTNNGVVISNLKSLTQKIIVKNG